MAVTPQVTRKGRPLSATFVRSVTRVGAYGDGPGGFGLILRVKRRKNGRIAKQWVQRVRINGKPTHLGVGAYPVTTLAEARQAALHNVREIKAGRDPRGEGIPTLERATEQVILLHRDGWKPGSKTEQQWRSTFATHLYPTLGRRPVDKITTGDLLAVLGPLHYSKPSVANVVKLRTGLVMRWAVAQGYRPDNPAGEALDAALPKNGKRTTHHRALHYSDVADALTTVRQSKAPTSSRLAVELLALTATRTAEVRGARWDEIDTETKTWTIPAERMKAGREHRVPLSGAALMVLADARRHSHSDGLVFPGRGGKPLGHATIGTLFKRLGIDGTPHGLRGSFRNWCSETGVPREVAERALAHVVKGATESAYNTTDLLDQRRPVMEAWADFLTPTS